MGKRLVPVISIIVPVYNEAENISQFYEKITEVLKLIGVTYEILFINDGSKDDTLAFLIDLHYHDARVKVVELSRNFGKEAATTAGLDFCSGGAVVPMDVDMQDPPEVLPLLFSKWKEGFEVVNAKRMVRNGDSWMKKITARFFYGAMRKISESPMPDNVGDFRLMDRKVVEVLKQMRERHRFMKGLFSWVGFKTAEVVYERQPRYMGKTKWNYFKLMNLAIEGLTSFSTIPLKIATFIGLVVSIGSFLYGIFAALKKLIFGDPVQGYTSMIVIILFLGGIQLLTIGIIGEYIGRIYNEAKRRPLYILSKTFGLQDQKRKMTRSKSSEME